MWTIKHTEKSDYLATISKDENVMKYIALKSDIGQEIEKQRQQVAVQVQKIWTVVLTEKNEQMTFLESAQYNN